LNRTLPPFRAAAPFRRQLLAAVALAVALHVLLLTGLPRLAFKPRPSEPDAAFVTRLVAPPPPPPPAPEPESEPPAPEPAAPAVEAPRPPRPKPAPRPKPPPAAPKPSVAQTDVPASLLAPPPLASFGGGGSAAMPIAPPLPAEDAALALKFAAGAGDAPARVAPSAEITYRTVGQFGGQAIDLQTKLNWRQDGQSYEARWVLYAPLIGEYTRSAAGLLSPRGLTPVTAALRTSQTQQDMRFDYAAQQVHFGAPDTDAPLRPGMQDRLGALLQLGALLAGDPARYPVGASIELPAAHPCGPGVWRFSVEAEARVTALQGRELPTLRLLHQPEDERDARIEVWLGPTVNYLPVRLSITEANGDTVEHTMQTAQALRPPPPPVAPPQ
jgi:hypothetical protein